MLQCFSETVYEFILLFEKKKCLQLKKMMQLQESKDCFVLTLVKTNIWPQYSFHRRESGLFLLFVFLLFPYYYAMHCVIQREF